MKKFFFRLETLLKLRKAKEGRGARDLAYTQQKWMQLKEKQETIERQIGGLVDEIRKKREREDHGMEETYSHLLEHLNSSLSQVQEAVALQGNQVLEKQEQLKELNRERKVLEKIKERHYLHWRIQSEQGEEALVESLDHRQ